LLSFKEAVQRRKRNKNGKKMGREGTKIGITNKTYIVVIVMIF
jgi:hypothetical protein